MTTKQHEYLIISRSELVKYWFSNKKSPELLNLDIIKCFNIFTLWGNPTLNYGDFFALNSKLLSFH